MFSFPAGVYPNKSHRCSPRPSGGKKQMLHAAPDTVNYILILDKYSSFKPEFLPPPGIYYPSDSEKAASKPVLA